MLDFLLVLGQIPGTNIRISFWQLFFGVILGLLTIRLYRRPALRRKYAYWFHLSLFYIQHFRILRRPHS